MSSQVGLHVAARGEAFLAHATRERPLSGVCSHMVLKTGVRLEPLTTDGTRLYALHGFVCNEGGKCSWIFLHVLVANNFCPYHSCASCMPLEVLSAIKI